MRIDNPFTSTTATTSSTYPVYTTTAELPSNTDWLASTGLKDLLLSKDYGKLSEGDVNKWFDTVAKQKLQEGLESNAARFAEAGYAPQYNAAEATGRLLSNLEGQRASLQYENAQSGLTRQAQAYNNILSAMAGRDQGIMNAYLNMYSKGLGTGTAGTTQQTSSTTPTPRSGGSGYQNSGYTGLFGGTSQQPTKASTQTPAYDVGNDYGASYSYSTPSNAFAEQLPYSYYTNPYGYTSTPEGD